MERYRIEAQDCYSPGIWVTELSSNIHETVCNLVPNGIKEYKVIYLGNKPETPIEIQGSKEEGLFFVFEGKVYTRKAIYTAFSPGDKAIWIFLKIPGKRKDGSFSNGYVQIESFRHSNRPETWHLREQA